MYGYGGYGFFFDPTYILVLIGILLTVLASSRMNSTFSKYVRVPSSTGLTGCEVARRILEANGIYDVTVQPIPGKLTDHYDPVHKTLGLSEPIYNSSSVAAIGVAAHECGHAIQDNRDYMPLRVRSAMVPLVNIGSNVSWPMILIGLLIAQSGLYFGYRMMSIGIVCFGLAVLFQLVTLPVELDASRRALKQLGETGILPLAEKGAVRRVLSAAAMTYVASAAASLLQLLRLLILFGGRRNRD